MPHRDTDAAGEVLMPVPAADALRGVEITILRQIGDNLAALTRSLERQNNKLDDVRERVIRLEAQKTHEEVAAITLKLETAMTRINTLESQVDQAKGAASVWTWLAKNAPWLFAGFAAFIAGLAVKAGLIK